MGKVNNHVRTKNNHVRTARAVYCDHCDVVIVTSRPIYVRTARAVYCDHCDVVIVTSRRVTGSSALQDEVTHHRAYRARCHLILATGHLILAGTCAHHTWIVPPTIHGWRHRNQ